MEHNPYSPPQTEVREAAVPNLAGPRPKQVTWAVRLFWVEFALSVIEYGLYWFIKSDNAARFVDLVGAAVSMPLEALVIYKIGRRRNWARYVALASIIVSALLWFDVSKQGISADPVTVILGGIELVLDWIALYLIFVNPGRQWFK